jgi:hypothetical protein
VSGKISREFSTGDVHGYQSVLGFLQTILNTCLSSNTLVGSRERDGPPVPFDMSGSTEVRALAAITKVANVPGIFSSGKAVKVAIKNLVVCR